MAGIATGPDHRHAHPGLAQPRGRMIGQLPPDAMALVGGIDREHLDLAQPALGIRDRRDHEPARPTAGVRDPTPVGRRRERLPDRARLVDAPVLSVQPAIQLGSTRLRTRRTLRPTYLQRLLTNASRRVCASSAGSCQMKIRSSFARPPNGF